MPGCRKRIKRWRNSTLRRSKSFRHRAPPNCAVNNWDGSRPETIVKPLQNPGETASLTLISNGFRIWMHWPPTLRSVEAKQSPPTFEELKNATYKDLAGIKDKVSLVNGKLEGRSSRKEPIRPIVKLLEPVRVTGDMNGDGVEESVVLLNLSTGGTGQLLHVAVVGRRSGRVENLATRMIGDRVQIRDVRITRQEVIRRRSTGRRARRHVLPRRGGYPSMDTGK